MIRGLYHARPVRVEAILWDGSPEAMAAIATWLPALWRIGDQLWMSTPDGTQAAELYDLVVRDWLGEVYPVPAKRFADTYEAVEEEA